MQLFATRVKMLNFSSFFRSQIAALNVSLLHVQSFWEIFMTFLEEFLKIFKIKTKINKKKS